MLLIDSWSLGEYDLEFVQELGRDVLLGTPNSEVERLRSNPGVDQNANLWIRYQASGSDNLIIYNLNLMDTGPL